MNILLGWIVLGLLAVLVSTVPPIFISSYEYGYWNRFKEYNTVVWGFLIGCGILTGLLVLGLTLIGVLNW
jgi:hypothetical protein